MAYQTIQPQPVVQSQDGPTRSGNSCLSCWCWTLQALVWILLVVGIILLLQSRYECFYGRIGCYIVYIILELCSPTFGYLRHQKGNDRMYEKMGELFRTAPVITFHCVCYHYETKHTTYKDSNGHVQNRTERVHVNTHSDTMELPYYSARDVSGLFLLNIAKANASQKAFIKLHLQKEVNFADAISYSDYIMQKDAFWMRNRYRDALMDFDETRTIPGFHTENLVQIGDYHPSGVSSGLYIASCFLMFCQFYKRYVDSFCVFQNYKIRKIVSTRFDLLQPTYCQQYAQITPALNLTGTMMTYQPADVGYCSSNYQATMPTAEELERAKQYDKMVPHYGFSSVGGDAQIGVVQDLPDFNEANYNQPPPAFSSMGGDVVLSDSQMNQGINVNMNVNPNMQMNNPNMNIQVNMNPNMHMQNQQYQPPTMQGGFQG